jgi:dTMP kinase
MFYSIDGGDGVGKSTQIALFCAWLVDQGQEVVTCRDPGSTRLGEAVRELLLNRHDLEIHRRAEMLLYMAARAQMVEEFIRPSLASGKTVVCDRFLLANVVYQGYAGGLDIETLWRVGDVAVGGLMPDLTIVLDMPAKSAVGRIDRELDRMEKQGADFHARVRDGFLIEAARRNDIVVINAARPIEKVHADIRAAVMEREKWVPPAGRDFSA